MTKRQDDLQRFGWPRRMGRRRAAAYAGVDVTTIDKARRNDELRPVGRRGGYGEFIYDIADIDAWMAGAPPKEKTRLPRDPSSGDWSDDLDAIAAGGIDE